LSSLFIQKDKTFSCKKTMKKIINIVKRAYHFYHRSKANLFSFRSQISIFTQDGPHQLLPGRVLCWVLARSRYSFG